MKAHSVISPPRPGLSAGRAKRFLSLFVGLVLAIGVFGAESSQAQEADLKRLVDQLKRLQTEMTTLQRHVYRGEEPPPPPPDSLSNQQAARLEVRLSEFEAELRSLTGKIEEQNFKISQFAKRLDKLVADVDDRLQLVEQQVQNGALAADGVAGAQTGTDATLAGTEGTAGVLGQISAEPAAASPETAMAPDATPEEQYEYAFGLLSRNDFDGAEQVLAKFLEQHPQDKLAGNAKYWLGETFYVRGRYADAAIAFAEGYEAYPESVKAPDNLLKLGKSLAALGQNEDACGTFAELHKRYSAAASAILQQAKNEQRKLSCQ